MHISINRIAVALALFVTAGVAVLPSSHAADAKVNDAKPTILLVHGAFAGSSSWNGVTKKLLAHGYKVVAIANPLRGVKQDSSYLSDAVNAIQGPVVLVGHSYGGSVISTAAEGKSNVKALVFVAALAPDVGESVAGLGGKFPGGTLDSALAPPVMLSEGGKDLYIQQDKFHAQFAADVSSADAALMAVTQRPVAASALGEAATVAAWKSIPSWFIYGSLDKNIPAAEHAFMAQRANARMTIVLKGASHVVMVSHPDDVSKLIESAATAK